MGAANREVSHQEPRPHTAGRTAGRSYSSNLKGSLRRTPLRVLCPWSDDQMAEDQHGASGRAGKQSTTVVSPATDV